MALAVVLELSPLVHCAILCEAVTSCRPGQLFSIPVDQYVVSCRRGNTVDRVAVMTQIFLAVNTVACHMVIDSVKAARLAVVVLSM